MSRRNQKTNLRDGKVRRGNASDCKKIESLLNFQVRQLFGKVDLEEKMLSKCYLTLVLEDGDEGIVGAVSFNDHPNVASVAPWAWQHWIKTLYNLETTNSWNTLFIDFLAWHKKCTFCFVDILLQYLFVYDYHLEYVILVAPPGVIEIEWLEGIATRILPDGCTDPYKVQTLYLMVRQHFVPKYTIRKAVEEDNDDLVPLIHSHSERLKEVYGEYYISEILTRHQESGRQIIVAEHANTVVAVLCLNSTVDFDTLNEQFELVPYYGLKKPHDADCIENVMKTCIRHDEDEYDEVMLTVERDDFQPASNSNWITSMMGDGVSSSGGDVYEQSSSQSESLEKLSEKDVRTVHSEDDFTIVNVSSLHLGLGRDGFARSSEIHHVDDDINDADNGNGGYDEEDEDDRFASLESNDSTLSVMILSQTNYDLIYGKMQLKSEKNDGNSSDSSIAPSTITQQQRHHQQTMYKKRIFHGEANAFVVEIAAATQEHEKGALVQLLEASFGCFPNRDYCIIGIPSTTPAFPLLRYFVRVTPRSICTFEQELYVLHRNSISSWLQVREARISDVAGVQKLVANIPKQRRFLSEFKAAVDGDAQVGFVAAFVMLNSGQPVGVAVLKEEEDVEYLKTHYELSNWFNERHHKTGSYGVVQHLVLTPIFQKHSRFFLRELHRLGDFSVLFYRLAPNDSVNASRERSLAAVIGDLLFVKPKVKPEFNHFNVEGCEPQPVVHRIDPPFTLHCSTVETCSLPRIEINAKLVIVGSSETSLAFLESLLYGYDNKKHDVTFTNVTLIAPHVHNHQKEPNAVRDMMFVITSNLSYRYLQMHQTRTYMNMMNGVLTEIDRKNKKCILNDGEVLSYDFLFLMCGEQYQKPKSRSVNNQTKNACYDTEYPTNVFIINTETDASHSLTSLKNLMTKTCKSYIIVYGHNLRAYCCISSLLEYGVPASRLIFVEPFPPETKTIPPHAVSCFNDSDVDAKVQSTILDLGVTVYSNYYFLDWTHNKEEKMVTSIRFESKHKMIDIECLAFFAFGDKSISTRTFLAINRAGLVFDGNLVIGPDCRTNDPYIYSAGTITKYSRRYYADHKSHKYYNAYEIGTKLGADVRRMLLSVVEESTAIITTATVPTTTTATPGAAATTTVTPVQSHQQKQISKDPLIAYGRPKGDMLVPTYTEPICNYCILPGKLYYLSVRKPGPLVPLESSMSSSSYGQVLVTGNCSSLQEKGYFRLHLNDYKLVETITCLSLEPIDRVNLTSLYGKHQALLNNVADRFNMLLVSDFYEFFRQPWTCAIYHDKFTSFQERTMGFLEAITEIEGESLIEDIFKMLKHNDFKKLTQNQIEELEEKFEGCSYQKVLVEMVLDYIKDNLNFLPMYAHPFIVNLILQDYQSSPCFTEL